MAYSGQVVVTPPGGTPLKASIEVGEDALDITPDGGTLMHLPFIDIDDVHDDDYTLRLTDDEGRRYDLSMLGKAYGQVLADLRKRRDDALQHDLLLTGVKLVDTFPGKLFGGREPIPVEIRLFEDLMVVVPERGTMFGVPYSFIESVRFDETLYQTHIQTDDGSTYVLGQMKLRSQEFSQELRRLLDALAARTARQLGELLPGVPSSVVSQLAAEMRDGRAVQRAAVDAIDGSLWPRLEEVVVGSDERRASYDRLIAMSPPGWAALGIKAIRTEESDETEAEVASSTADAAVPSPSDASAPAVAGDPAVPAGGDVASADEPARTSILWYFVPLADGGRPMNAVAQEVTSEGGRATYVFRLMEPERFSELQGEELRAAASASIARLNRALLTLNFRREPIYLPEEQIREGRYARYRVALRKLDYLRWARSAFLGRAIHNESWEQQLIDVAGRA